MQSLPSRSSRYAGRAQARAQTTWCLKLHWLHAQESDEDEQVRKTALREVRILKVESW